MTQFVKSCRFENELNILLGNIIWYSVVYFINTFFYKRAFLNRYGYNFSQNDKGFMYFCCFIWTLFCAKISFLHFLNVLTCYSKPLLRLLKLFFFQNIFISCFYLFYFSYLKVDSTDLKNECKWNLTSDGLPKGIVIVLWKVKCLGPKFRTTWQPRAKWVCLLLKVIYSN